MNVDNLVRSLETNQKRFEALLSEVSPADAIWKPASGNWSILEIACHLLDEERFDFRPRLKSVLEDPNQSWEPWDPEGTAVTSKYNEQDLDQILPQFMAQRTASLDWLKQLPESNWESAREHPRMGSISAGDLLSAWAAHDCLHLHQLGKRFYEIVERDAGQFKVIYAGKPPA